MSVQSTGERSCVSPIRKAVAAPTQFRWTVTSGNLTTPFSSSTTVASRSHTSVFSGESLDLYSSTITNATFE